VKQPDDYFILLENISKQNRARNEPADFIHLFIKTKKDFDFENEKNKKE
jgi:hypothetical protein